MNTARKLYSTATATASATKSKLTWADYFKLRQKRNNLRPLFGIPTALASSAAMINLPFNPFTPILSIDPAFVMIFGTIITTGISYHIGSLLANFTYTSIDDKDKIFYSRIEKYRSQQSPYIIRTSVKRDELSDYYGERIKSLSDYRHWLRRHMKRRKEIENRDVVVNKTV